VDQQGFIALLSFCLVLEMEIHIIHVGDRFDDLPFLAAIVT
jgi:hypothetical protein